MNKFLIILLLLSPSIFSYDGVFEAPHKHQYPPINDIFTSSNKNLATNDLTEMLSYQSPVKSQGSRGTCSIFSAVAMLESLLIRDNLSSLEVDLSEEWVEFLSISSRNATSDGSWSYYNWNMISQFGIPKETTLPYESSKWTNANYGLAKVRCGDLVGNKMKSCLLGHFNPAFLKLSNNQIKDELFLTAKRESLVIKNDYLDAFLFPISSPWSSQYRVNSLSEIKSNLRQFIPMTLAIDVYYGAWNHRVAGELNIGIDSYNWSQGIVSNPEPGSMDKKLSPTKRAGHSVLIIGYDDNKIVSHKMKMQDGTYKTFTYKGVYYFKNSWGTSGFGSNATIQGHKTAGYGMITYKYANRLGTFYKLPLL